MLTVTVKTRGACFVSMVNLPSERKKEDDIMHTIGRNSAFWRVYTSLPIVILLALVLTPAILQAAHPFLIVTEANYPELQARASGSPWSDIKANALNDASNLVYDPGLYPYKIKTSRLRDVVSSCSLAYILDPTNRTQYKNKIRGV